MTEPTSDNRRRSAAERDRITLAMMAIGFVCFWLGVLVAPWLGR